MKRVHILTINNSPNALAFNFPLKINRGRLKDYGISIDFFCKMGPKIFDCDAVCIASGVYRTLWPEHEYKIFADIEALNKRNIPVYWFDTTDSTYSTQAKVLPYVRCYYKAQLLKDRTAYQRVYRGGRVYTDYFHRLYGVEDQTDTFAATIEPKYFSKLKISWNSGLDNHGLARFKRFRRMKDILRDLLRLRYSYNVSFVENWERPMEVTCRVSTNYLRSSVRMHREKIIAILQKRGVNTDKVAPREYLQELAKSKIAVSPFGLGEITLRDFEIIISGALLFKPAMEHLETWPDLFTEGETYVGFKWDLSDFDEKLNGLLQDPVRIERIAALAQDRYRYFFSNEGQEEFCKRFIGMVSQ